jgi:predicted ester cyclase
MNQAAANKQIIRVFIEELNTRHDPDTWNTFCAENSIHHLGLPDVPPNREGIRQLWTKLWQAFPDVRLTVELILAEGDWVVVRATAQATHSGRYNGMEPTGKLFRWTETHCYRLENGKITEHFPEIRLEKLLWELTGRGMGFIAPAPSALSGFIALLMGGLSAVYKAISPKTPQTEAANRAVVHTYVDEFKNKQNFLVFPKLFSRRFTHHFDFPGRTDRMDSFVSVGQNFLSAFPDVRVDLKALLTEGNFVVERNSVSATHRGTFNGVKSTDRQVNWTEIHIYRLKEGRIVENWPAVNFERIHEQLLDKK